MIDIHSHILPWTDDGAENMYESLDMIISAYEGGTEIMAATPHVNIPGMYDNYYDQEYVDKYKMLKDALKEEHIDVKIVPGMEVFVTEDLPKLIEDGKVITLNKTKYMLLEFDFDEDPDFTFHMLDKVMQMKIRPVIAHAERYRFIQNEPEILKKWKEKSVIVQMNKDSFTGGFGTRAMDTALKALDDNTVSVIASDAHGAKRRTSPMDRVRYELSANYDPEYLKVLFEENPKRILSNRPVLVRRSV